MVSSLAGDEVDLVLIDLSLAEMSGLDLVSALTQQWPDLPLIVLSGQPAVEMEAVAREAGASMYVEKGDAEALLAAIYSTLGPGNDNLDLEDKEQRRE